MTAIDPRVIGPGERVFLRPVTLTASADCYRQPEVLVISGPENGVYEVELPDSRVIHVHEDDVARRRPEPPRERVARPRPELPGAVEVPLW